MRRHENAFLRGGGNSISEDDRERDNPGGIRVPPPAIYLSGLIAGFALDRTAVLPTLPGRLSRPPGLALAIAGILLAGWFGRTMRSSGASFRLDEPAERLLTGGPFQYSRNPGYLSFALIYAGVSLLTRSSWSALFLPVVLTVIRVRVIEQEERYLEREFGGEYRGYKARVRRWI